MFVLTTLDISAVSSKPTIDIFWLLMHKLAVGPAAPVLKPVFTRAVACPPVPGGHVLHQLLSGHSFEVTMTASLQSIVILLAEMPVNFWALFVELQVMTAER